MRILQETVDTTRFAPCGQNMFRNNIVVMRNTLSTHVNIGANTAPSTYTLANNLWYMSDNVDRSRPNAPPLTEQNGLYGIDPRFMSASDLHLQPGSPAIGAGTGVDSLGVDFDGRAYAVPPSAGAFEGAVPSGVASNAEHRPVGLVRTQRGWVIETATPLTIDVYDLTGRYLRTEHAQQGSNVIGGVDTFIVVQRE